MANAGRLVPTTTPDRIILQSSRSARRALSLLKSGSAERLCAECQASSPVPTGETLWPSTQPCSSCGASVLVADSIPFFAPELAGVFDGQSGYDPNGLAGLQEAEDEHFWFVPRRRLVLALIERYAPEARNLLEIGCGTGATLLAIARSRRWDALFGSDIHPNGLQATKRRVGSRTTLVQLDARNIPARNAFDVICALDVIEHIEQDETVLRSMHGALTDEGIVVLAVPQHSFLWSKYDVSTGHVRRYAPRELDQKVAKAGFDVLFSGSYTAILLPLMYLSRLRFRKGADDEITELRPAGMLNWLLKTALQAEVTATLAGLRFPFGGSRFVVAKKLSSRIRASG